MTGWRIITGDARTALADLKSESVHTVITSPPYFGLRDYGTGAWEGGAPDCDHRGGPRGSTSSTLKNDGRPNPGQQDYERDVRTPYREECGKCGGRRVDSQLGLEATPDQYVAGLVDVFRQVRRVLRDDGTVWLNLGDSYAGNANSGGVNGNPGGPAVRIVGLPAKRGDGIKPKDLLGIPWMVAFALRADGWYLRSDIIWAKPNPMPESVTDRPTKAHEYLFLLSKGPRYYYDADAIREPQQGPLRGGEGNYSARGFSNNGDRARAAGREPSGNELPGAIYIDSGHRNKRSVWIIATQPYSGAHFATFPPKLIEPCVLAGAPERCCVECGAPETPGFEPSCECGDTFRRNQLIPADRTAGVVLDPFAGAGTTGMVALRRNRSFIGIELNPLYAAMARDRIRDDAPLLNWPLEVAT